jgi:hypothetical protein
LSYPWFRQEVHPDAVYPGVPDELFTYRLRQVPAARNANPTIAVVAQDTTIVLPNDLVKLCHEGMVGSDRFALTIPNASPRKTSNGLERLLEELTLGALGNYALGAVARQLLNAF